MSISQEVSLNQKLDNLQTSISALIVQYRNRGTLLEAQAAELTALKANPKVDLADEEVRVDNLISSIQAELSQPEPTITIPGQVVENPDTNQLEESTHPDDQRPLDVPDLDSNSNPSPEEPTEPTEPTEDNEEEVDPNL